MVTSEDHEEETTEVRVCVDCEAPLLLEDGDRCPVCEARKHGE